ncbi:MAG: NAD(+) diphosphatase [Treponema sp.]|nr:NAD(+) diphosphatase [Treponema sp.]
MKEIKSSGAYIFQEGSLVVPEGIAESDIQHQMSWTIVDHDFKDYPLAEAYDVPDLGGSDLIGTLCIPKGDLPPGWKALPMRAAVNTLTGGTMADGTGPAGKILRAYHIVNWRRESRFCGTCGGANGDAENESLARLCPLCGRLEFPRIVPAVITIITNDENQALLAHNKRFTSGVYSLIAGFNEAGEGLEATVAREIMEEVNISVKDIRFIRSQPWPFPNQLMLGFSARYAGGELKPDGVEIGDAQWFSRENLPELPASGSVSRYLISLWYEGKL